MSAFNIGPSSFARLPETTLGVTMSARPAALASDATYREGIRSANTTLTWRRSLLTEKAVQHEWSKVHGPLHQLQASSSHDR
jgi:hypothetical protein